ncbi:MAG: 16S rRNA (guanine(966)-N(2))-methyltransferase RsmD [Candidatus Omnitrophica bacterium]|nr:16S rRNA (guanine(966)-N(2))-methyltransferase RsmD [Candidatus Omnitrophota bacterium]
MKILGGKFKNRNFFMPKDLRPSQNIIRKAIFDILGNDLSGLTFLDLFAGSGAFGLEALSRGAKKVVFIERDMKNFEVIQENISMLPFEMGLDGFWPYSLLNSDVFATIKVLAAKGEKFDVIAFDPPYGEGLGKKVLKTLNAYDILHPSCVVIAEHSRREILPEVEGRIRLFRKKVYGNTLLSIYKKDSSCPA